MPCFSANPPVWRYWSSQDGFEESNCVSVSETADGRILVNHGGVNHMSVLDGYHVKRIPSPSHHVKVHEGPRGSLWAFSSIFLSKRLRGFTTFDPVKHKWDEIFLPGFEDSLFIPQIWDFAPLEPDLLCFATRENVKMFEIPSSSIANPCSVTDTCNTRFYSDVISSKQGGAWVSGDASVIHIFPKGKENKRVDWEEYPYPVETDVSLYFGNKIAGQDGGLFMTKFYNNRSKQSLMRLNNGTWETVYDNESIQFYLGWQDSNHRCWLYGKVFHYLDGGTVTTFKPHGILSLGVQDILLQNNDVFWLAMPSGLARYAPPLWQTPPGARAFDDYILSMIAEDDRGGIWFAGVTQFIHILGNEIQTYPYPEDCNVTPLNPRNFIFMDDDSFLMGAVNYQYLQFFPNEGRFELIQHPNHRAGMIFPRDRQTVWAFTREEDNRYKTLELYDGKIFQEVIDVYSFENFPQWVTDCRETADGDIWIGHTFEMGPGRIRDGVFKVFGPDDGYNEVGAPCILELPNGIIWVGGRNSISAYDGRRWKTVKTNLGTVADMLQAEDGSIWVAAESGIYHLVDKSWIHYTTEQGLLINLCANIHEDREGRIWVGTSRGLRRFHPKADREPPETYFDFDANLKEVGPHGDATFVFSGMDKWKYTPLEQLYYSHRIDNRNWSPYTKQTVASYTNLTPGEHTFEVRAMDLNMNIDPTPIQFTFRVVPVWYKEPVFLLILLIGLLILLISLALHLLHHYNLENTVEERTRNLLAQQAKLQSLTSQLSLTEERERRKIASDLHDRIGHGLAACQMKISSLLRSRAGKTEAEELRQAKHIVSQVIDDTRTLTFEISPPILYEFGLGAALEWLCERFQAQYEISFHFYEDNAEKKIPEESLGFLFRAVRELLFNVVKHAKADTVQVLLTCEREWVRIVVEDNGVGMRQDSSLKPEREDKGFGLFHIQERIGYLKGVFDCENSETGGTRIILKVLLD